MDRRHTARVRVLAVVPVVMVLLLVSSVSAWAWWAETKNAVASGAAPLLAAPTGVDAECNPLFNFQNDPVVLTWDAVAVPTGATQVRYRVQFYDGTNRRYFPTPTTEVTGTTLSVLSTSLGTTAERTRLQTITVQAVAVYPTGKLESAASQAVTAQGESVLTVIDMHC